MTTDEVLSAFAALPLPVRMRAAVDVLADADKRRGSGGWWWFHRPLLQFADQWEAEDAAESDRAHLVEGLAMAMATHFDILDPDYKDQWRNKARELLKRFDITPKEKP